MRELPEPEVSAELAEAQRFLAMWQSVTVRPMTTREVDFAKLVRKQAYEDGLMDATQRLAESSADVDDMFAKIHASPAFELESVRKSFGAAMLTASQKEPQ